MCEEHEVGSAGTREEFYGVLHALDREDGLGHKRTRTLLPCANCVIGDPACGASLCSLGILV